jgi:hypothetical protein
MSTCQGLTPLTWEEQFSRKYKLESLGYNFEKVVERVSILLQVEKDYPDAFRMSRKFLLFKL